MDRWASYLLLTITCISLLTFFKVVFKKKSNGIPDTIALQQKNIKTLRTALYPEKAGEEIGTAILYTIKGGKKMKNKIVSFVKLVYGNKFTALSLLLNVIYTGLAQYLLYSDALKDISFFADNKLVCIIVATAISVIWLIIELVKDFKNYGFESLEALNKKWAERKAEKDARLSKEQREIIKKTIGDFTDKIKVIEDTKKKLEETLKPFINTIGSYKTLRDIGIPISVEQDNEYSNAVAESNKINGEISILDEKKKQLEAEVSVLKAKL